RNAFFDLPQFIFRPMRYVNMPNRRECRVSKFVIWWLARKQLLETLTHSKIDASNRRHNSPSLVRQIEHFGDQGSEDRFALTTTRRVKRVDKQDSRLIARPIPQHRKH